MQTCHLQKFGLDGLVPVEQQTAEPGPGEVRVRWRQASLNYHDLATVLGMANPRMALPQVPLSDGAGEIEAVGEGVADWQPGDRVMSRFFPCWDAGRPTLSVLRQVTGESLPGVLSQQALVPAHWLLPVPDYMTLEEAACLPCAALTAWRALVVEAGIRPGQKVLVQGSGGVSLFAARFAAMLGAEVFAISSSNDRLDVLAGQGARHLLNYREQPHWGRAIRQLSGGGVDLVVEVGGAGTLAQSLEAVAVDAHVSMIGVLTGVAAPVATARIMAANTTVRGITVGNANQQRDMLAAMSLHQVRPYIGARLPMASIGEALALMQGSGHVGKICIDLG